MDVDEEILEEAQPIQLSASFEESLNEPYHYELPDKIEADSKPPAAIKITKLPKKGSMKTKVYGKEKVI